MPLMHVHNWQITVICRCHPVAAFFRENSKHLLILSKDNVRNPEIIFSWYLPQHTKYYCPAAYERFTCHTGYLQKLHFYGKQSLITQAWQNVRCGACDQNKKIVMSHEAHTVCVGFWFTVLSIIVVSFLALNYYCEIFGALSSKILCPIP